MDLEQFFRAHYKSIVGYCSGFGHNPADVEEVASDVILRCFDDYNQKVQIEEPLKWRVVRRWMARRTLFDLLSKYRKQDALMKAEPFEEQGLDFDTPEAILDLKQRLPQVPAILLEYEPNLGMPEFSERKGSKWALNDPNDRVKYCRAKKKFLKEFER